jgi:FdrA protein
MALLTLVRPSFYQDSVALLALARELRARPDIVEAAALMGTPANRELLAQAGLLTAEAAAAGPNDLVVVIDAAPAAALQARARAEELLSARHTRREHGGRHAPRTIDGALRRMPDADLALISVPGAWAAAEARRALARGLHVMIWSDNVSIEDEVALKQLAARRGLLVMGPDCGTAYLGGIPLGFANLVPRGRVGMVAASGTGLQQVAALLAAQGEGISQAIGVGSRDMSLAVGGLMTLAALDALGADAATEVITVIGKPGAPAVRRAVETKLRAIGKPAVVAVLGKDVRTGTEHGITTVATLEDACRAVIAGSRWSPRAFSLSPEEVRRRVEAARRGLRGAGTAIRGLYAGGTLAHEAALVLEPWLGPIDTNMSPRPPERPQPLAPSRSQHQIVDLGADEHTVSRAHPMLDPTLRLQAIAAAARDEDVGVLLLDVVLGLGAAADPAADLAPALEAARGRGRALAIVLSVIGTAADPQGLAGQIARLERAGAWVLPSNAQAARAAACIAGPDRVMNALLTEGIP